MAILDYTIDFRAGGQGQQFLIAGWSHHEDNYTWTLGKTSVIRFPEADGTCDYILKFSGEPLVREGKIDFQRLYVEINSEIVCRLVLRRFMEVEFFLPSRSISSNCSIEIIFHLPDAESPNHVAESDDSRDLGVAMKSLSLQRFALAPPRAPESSADRAMLMDIQSLGENCEVAFVQRLYGAEPFGLFRWAATPLSKLLPAMNARFEGLGRPENLDVVVDDASEYQIIDKKYGFKNHSFAFVDTGIQKADILKREAVRLPFMARLLCKELERGNRLFCFHDAGGSGRHQIEALLAVMGSYGPNTLLWVCPAIAPEQIGTAKRVHERLICGYLDRFEQIDKVVQPSYDSWMQIIRAAHKLWQAS
jgi:hypothetical protein